MWADNLGVTVNVEQSEFGLFLQDLDKGNFQMFDLGWIADYADPQNFIEIKFHSANIGFSNEARFNNPEVDALIEQAQTEQDEAKRFQLYQQAEQIIVDEAPWIPLYHGKDNALIKPYVQNFLLAPLVIPTLRFVSIAEQ